MKTKDNAKFHIVLVAGVVEKNGKYLIAQRSYKEIQEGGKWSIPGGKVEVQTQHDDYFVLEKTLVREIQEEVGIHIKNNPTYVQSTSFVRVDGATVVGTLFLCRWKSGKAKPLEDSINVAWITIEGIDSYDLAKGVKNALLSAHKKFQERG